MTLKFSVPAALLLLSACGTVLDEQRTSATLPSGFYKGEPYEIVTQTVEGQNGNFVRTKVVYKGQSVLCVRDSPRDCEFAARRLIDERFSVGF